MAPNVRRWTLENHSFYVCEAALFHAGSVYCFLCSHYTCVLHMNVECARFYAEQRPASRYTVHRGDGSVVL